MTELKPNDVAPDFSVPLAEGSFSLKDAQGKYLVLYFYPKDNTKGCTIEAIDFTARADAFAAANAVVLGISPDSARSHARFADKHALTVLLGADEDHAVAQAYGVWKQKSMYGKTYMGIERSTFLISPEGRIVKVFAKVKVDGHADAVLAAITEG
ncbi:thioredoxin-dependent thiol peroxidase [Martelella alba]|uniref:thioredoxin-dependent peroxiredoxin n=1 Tax=Martelella alba TaxID=2590451 RepID=A0A506UA31_9HYPH|nr:thioredoxin-dependent thiol peroxidase [Martelella alba]TPW29805.1 thioredoxin-dependent thiol peroxidase [Martelella alba]